MISTLKNSGNLTDMDIFLPLQNIIDNAHSFKNLLLYPPLYCDQWHIASYIAKISTVKC